MSGFSEFTMRERLMKLTNTTHSIQTLSMWILHHQKKNADAILDTWLKVYFGNSVVSRPHFFLPNFIPYICTEWSNFPLSSSNLPFHILPKNNQKD